MGTSPPPFLNLLSSFPSPSPLADTVFKQLFNSLCSQEGRKEEVVEGGKDFENEGGGWWGRS